MHEQDEQITKQEEVDPMPFQCNQPNCPYVDLISASNDKVSELIAQNARVEEHVLAIKKMLEGNGVPGLITRVTTLEAESNQAKGSSTVKKIVRAFVLALILAACGWGVNIWSTTHKDEQAVQQSLMQTDKRLENKIDGVDSELKQHEQRTAAALAQRGNK